MAKSLGYAYADLGLDNIRAKFFGQINAHPVAPSILMQRCLSSEGLLVLHAASEAMNHAFGGTSTGVHYKPERAAVIIGSGWAGIDAGVDLGAHHEKKRNAHPFINLRGMPSGAATACAIQYQLRGGQNTLMAACAAGGMAIGQAYRDIERGTADIILAGGVESIRHPASVWSIDVLQALSKEQQDATKACCPFSADRSGFVLSEGAAILVLEAYDSAKERGANILGEVLGYGYQCDAESFTGLGADISARARSITLALEDAGIKGRQVDYINAHGTSTPDNDVHETRAVKAALGARAYKVPISSTKSYTGHLVGAAGALETILCLKTIETGIIPATANLANPDALCDLNYLPNDHFVAPVQTCINLNSGFGGHNSALVLGSVE